MVARKLRLQESELGPELTKLRKEGGFSIEQMAKAIQNPKITRQLLYQYESARLLPSRERFRAIAEAYARNDAERSRLWQLFAAAHAVKLPADEWDYANGLLSVFRPLEPDREAEPQPGIVYVLEGRAVVTQSPVLHRLMAQFLLKNDGNRICFITPALREEFDQIDVPGSRQTSIYDWARLALAIEDQTQASRQAARELLGRVRFYKLPDISTPDVITGLGSVVRKACLQLWRLCRPETTTSYAEARNGDVAGYLCVEVTQKFYRWFWLTPEIVRRDLRLIHFLEQANVLKPIDVTFG